MGNGNIINQTFSLANQTSAFQLWNMNSPSVNNKQGKKKNSFLYLSYHRRKKNFSPFFANCQHFLSLIFFPISLEAFVICHSALRKKNKEASESRENNIQLQLHCWWHYDSSLSLHNSPRWWHTHTCKRVTPRATHEQQRWQSNFFFFTTFLMSLQRLCVR